MQSGGYPLTLLPAQLLSQSKIFYTPYGSDLFWFQNHAKHLTKIRRTLLLVDGIFPECERDGELARQHGFQGELMTRMPAAGTLQFDVTEPAPILGRSKITVKGYGGTWGRAIHVLHALEAIQDYLVGFEIHLTSVTKDVAKEIRRLQSSSKLNLVPHPKFSLSSEEMRALLIASKFHIALSASDGFPASLIEALMCGAIPIQSDTACLPDSLVEISPKNFVSTENWDQIGQVMLSLDADQKKLQLLSDSFTAWAKNQAIEPEQFRSIVSEAYGITRG
jgi:glycosyltransferase involved in cell wall biosynthesis